MRKLFAAGILVIVSAACTERRTTEAVERVVEEDHKASEALVHAAKIAATKAGDHAQQAAEAAREAFDAATDPEHAKK